jgi:hypothetical protein
LNRLLRFWFLGVLQQGEFKNAIKKIAEIFPQPPKEVLFYLLTYVTFFFFSTAPLDTLCRELIPAKQGRLWISIVPWIQDEDFVLTRSARHFRSAHYIVSLPC